MWEPVTPQRNSLLRAGGVQGPYVWPSCCGGHTPRFAQRGLHILAPVIYVITKTWKAPLDKGCWSRAEQTSCDVRSEAAEMLVSAGRASGGWERAWARAWRLRGTRLLSVTGPWARICFCLFGAKSQYCKGFIKEEILLQEPRRWGLCRRKPF